MNGINIDTKDTVVLNLLVVGEVCINAIGARLRAVPLFSIRFHLLSLGTHCGEEPASLQSLLLLPNIANMI